jgi:DNA-binding NtrC family response regulator
LKETILLVDDELSYLELLKSILQQEGYSNVITESNPLNVPGILSSQKIDLILLDIYMPQMNGLQLLEQITPEYPNIPVIIVTAVDDKEIALEAIKFGAYEFIIKPPDTDRLLLTIRRAIGYKLLERERDVLRAEALISKIDDNKFSNIITDSDTMRKSF